jgi:predicted PurR-regulated permease PerM
MRQILKYTGYILVLLLIGFLIYKFYYIIVWLLIAAVVSFIGEPLVKFFDRVHIKKFHIPHWLSSLLALFIIFLFIVGLLSVFVPLIIRQAEAIARIDIGKLGEDFNGPIQWLDNKLRESGTLAEDQTLNDFFAEKIRSIISLENLGSFISTFVNAAGSIFLGLFSIMFISFFFLKDENMFQESILLIIPEKYEAGTKRVVADSKLLLKRYFTGILFELIVVITLISVGLWILGVKNALIIGFFGGIMNIIPYLGPILGAIIGISLGITGTLAGGSVTDLLPVLIKLLSVIVIVQFIDNNILVPMIYARSVKSHPLEIFLVIIMGGGLAGLPGMLMAVPVYTVLRVIAKEFFQEFRVVQKITETMDNG